MKVLGEISNSSILPSPQPSPLRGEGVASKKIEKKKSNFIDFIKKYNLKDNLIFILSDKMDFDKKVFKSLNVFNEVNYINIFDFFENNLIEKNINLSFKNDKSFMEFNF